jgi:hypothetical protein
MKILAMALNHPRTLPILALRRNQFKPMTNSDLLAGKQLATDQVFIEQDAAMHVGFLEPQQLIQLKLGLTIVLKS